MPKKNVANWTLADYERAALEYSESLRDAPELQEQLEKARDQAAREKRRADAAAEEVKRLQALLTQQVAAPKKGKRKGS